MLDEHAAAGRIARNIPVLQALSALQFSLFIMPIVVVFYRSCGLSLGEIMLLQAAFALTIVALEIPTGYAADVLGRRRTLVLGFAFKAAGATLYCVSSTFGWFLASEVILGVGGALLSGTDTATLYDSLRALGLSAERPERVNRPRRRRRSSAAFSPRSIFGSLS